MVFSSVEFLWFFMPVVLGAYLLSAPEHRNLLLAAASLVFYAWGGHAVVLLFAASIGVNFALGRLVHRYRRDERGRALRWTVRGAVAANLLVLFVWKYVPFVTSQLDHAIGWFGTEHAIGVPDILLPIGISFFTFHAISYIVDTGRGEAPPLGRLRDFAQYMAFFPQLIAGPIIRYHQIDDQLHRPPPRSQRLNDLADGFPRFALGLSKKVLIADRVGPIADGAFANTHGLPSPAAWLAVLAYGVQIYFDFSGYSDMAIGLGRMFGFRFPENFARPYSALSVTDFWRRWHITLSQWLRDYVYIPLGGSRTGRFGTSANLLFVFFLVGVWHGAAWTFVLWGIYHGLLVVLERKAGLARTSPERMPVLRRAATFLLVTIGWALFRATSVGDAGRMLAALGAFRLGPLPPLLHDALNGASVSALVFGLASVALPPGFVAGKVILDGAWSGLGLGLRAAVIALLPVAAISVAAGTFSPFLYFRF